MGNGTASLPPSERQSWILDDPVMGFRIAGTSLEFLLPGRDVWAVGRVAAPSEGGVGSIIIDSPHVSERHCTIEHRHGRWIVFDQDSRNGIYLGDERRTMIELVPGLAFRIASIPCVAFSEAGRRGRATLQRYLGFADAFQLGVEAALRLASERRHVALVEPPGGAALAVARVLHDASPRATWPFEVVTEIGGEREQRKLMDRAACGTVVFRAEHLPSERTPLLRWFAGWTYNVRLIVLTPPGKRLAPVLGEDLLRATSVIPIPTLAERAGEIPALAAQLAHDVCVRLGRMDLGLTRDDLAAIARLSWPGNYEELRDYVERLIALRAHDGRVRPAARWLDTAHGTLLAWKKKYGMN